jgi:hypothetical protein
MHRHPTFPALRERELGGGVEGMALDPHACGVSPRILPTLKTKTARFFLMTRFD